MSFEVKKPETEKKKFKDSVDFKVKSRKGRPCSCGCDEYDHSGRGKYVCKGCGNVYSLMAIKQ